MTLLSRGTRRSRSSPSGGMSQPSVWICRKTGKARLRCRPPSSSPTTTSPRTERTSTTAPGPGNLEDPCILVVVGTTMNQVGFWNWLLWRQGPRKNRPDGPTRRRGEPRPAVAVRGPRLQYASHGPFVTRRLGPVAWGAITLAVVAVVGAPAPAAGQSGAVPDRPPRPVADAVGHDFVTLSWDDPGDRDHHRLPDPATQPRRGRARRLHRRRGRHRQHRHRLHRPTAWMRPPATATASRPATLMG